MRDISSTIAELTAAEAKLAELEELVIQAKLAVMTADPQGRVGRINLLEQEIIRREKRRREVRQLRGVLRQCENNVHSLNQLKRALDAELPEAQA